MMDLFVVVSFVELRFDVCAYLNSSPPFLFPSLLFVLASLQLKTRAARESFCTVRYEIVCVCVYNCVCVQVHEYICVCVCVCVHVCVFAQGCGLWVAEARHLCVCFEEVYCVSQTPLCLIKLPHMFGSPRW